MRWPWPQGPQVCATGPLVISVCQSRAAARDGWHAVETVIDEAIARDLIPELRDAGAEDIVEYPLNKVIH